tara:strand:+ start:1541 stop:2260 length:720 start_codon:yes stop_codon:yes gene_type:complete
MLGMELIKNEPTTLYADMHIQQQEWLNGADVEPMTRSDAFDWVYEKFGEHLQTWPVVGDDCRTLPSPFGWSWFIPGKINQKFKPGTHAELIGPPTVDCENITHKQIVKYIGDKLIDVHPRIAIDFTARCNRVPIKYNAEPIGFGAKKLPVYYIAGPMTGYVNFNRESFHSAGLKLSMKGHILNPAMLPDGLTQQQYMSICLPMVQAATHIFMLKGWEKSPGALTEHGLAVKLKLVVEYE